MATGTAKWGMFLPMVAAGAVAAYAYSRRAPHRNGNGIGAIADIDSDTRQKLGGPRGIHVEKSVVVRRQMPEVFRFWRNLENLPKFMKHLESVSMRAEGVSHWVARGPKGLKVSWDARIINEVDNKLIGWQSLSGSMVSTAGSVNFDEVPEGTRVTVKLQYSPAAGKLGAVIARLLSEDPSEHIREDLSRFKQLLETGHVIG